MDVVAFFVAQAEPAVLEEPGEYALHDATMFTQSTAMLATSLGQNVCVIEDGTCD